MLIADVQVLGISGPSLIRNAAQRTYSVGAALCFSGIARLKMKRLQLGGAEAVIPGFRATCSAGRMSFATISEASGFQIGASRGRRMASSGIAPQR
jgi:hypothetical protein